MAGKSLIAMFCGDVLCLDRSSEVVRDDDVSECRLLLGLSF